MKKSLFLFFVLCCSAISAQNNSTSNQLTISGSGWKVWLDSTAVWQNDSLVLPTELNLKGLPVNPPTCGWDAFYKSKGILAKLPASFEELFGRGNPTWRYHGVGWFYKEIFIPDNWAGKVLQMNIEKARLRVELYINEQLAGYDLLAETPIKFDVSNFMVAGKKNRIAFRITNPDGQRGWDDAPAIKWGKYLLIPGHDFGGIGGEVTLTAHEACYIDDVFVKNLLPANERRIEIQSFIQNKNIRNQALTLQVEILSAVDNTLVYSNKWNCEANANGNTIFSKTINVPLAKLWDTDAPNLYYCKTTITGNDFEDTQTKRFGFRTFEVKANEKGENNFYLNGKRIRLRSAIDWGYYTQTGFYAMPETARKSVENAKAIGMNCLNFHRRMGEPLVMYYADELGLLIYEEPGGAHGVDDLAAPSEIENKRKKPSYFTAMTFPEKFKRMVLRDRNHPSLIIYSIANEQCNYDYVHKRIFSEISQYDNSRLLINQSGGHHGGLSGFIPYLKPYRSMPELNYIDDHTVDASSRFQESDLKSHATANDSCIMYWGEVRCYCGPSNYFKLSTPKDTVGYDFRCYKPLATKTEQYFKRNNLAQSGSRNIQSPADMSVQAGRGLMYIDGRLSQSIMIHNSEDGFAINGWSDEDLSLGDHILAWYSAICDVGRNLKGPANDFSYWNRPLQIAVLRQNKKYVNVGDTSFFDIHLINEGKLAAGNFKLVIKVKDGNGKYTNFTASAEVTVAGGDTYSQPIFKSFPVTMQKDWKAGYITLECKLLNENIVVANGTEQVLLQNRASYRAELKSLTATVLNWDAAQKAIDEAGISTVDISKLAKVILVGKVPQNNDFESLLKRVKTDGSTMIVKFDSTWTNILLKNKILKTKVTEWGGTQKPYWNGNGWGYLDYYVGNQSIPCGQTIGTNSWEVSCDPVGFAPFESDFPQQSFGAFFYNPDKLLTLIGTVKYGKGKIILAPSYPVDLNNPFSDLLYYNMITK